MGPPALLFCTNGARVDDKALAQSAIGSRASCAKRDPRLRHPVDGRYGLGVQRFFLAIAVGASLLGCSRPNETVHLVPPAAGPPLATSQTASSNGPRLARDPEENTAPKPGHGAFTGMVRPTKGGYDVHGVFFDDALFKKRIDENLDGIPTDRDWFLGAKVRVTATLGSPLADEPEPSYRKGAIVEQRRFGVTFEVKSLESVELLKNAETLEGPLARSKGFFALKGHLVTEDDLGWSIRGGAKEGDRVRLRGQTRVVVCEPNAQCLMEGSLPLFDVGHGERLP